MTDSNKLTSILCVPDPDKQAAIHIVDRISSHGIFTPEYVEGLFTESGHHNLFEELNLFTYTKQEIESKLAGGFINAPDGQFYLGWVLAIQLADYLSMNVRGVERIGMLDLIPGLTFQYAYQMIGGSKQLVTPPRIGIDTEMPNVG